MPVFRITVAATLVTVGVCIMHYMGMLSQTGNFSMTYSPGIIAASAVVAAIAGWAGLAIFFLLFDSILFRILAAIVVSLAVNGMHYTGMQSAKYYVSPYRGIWGSSTVAWTLPALSVLIGVLVLNFSLMAGTGYYVEVLETVRKREGEAFEKELRHKGYMKNSRDLIQRSKVMRYPMCLVRFDIFARLGKLVPHEVLRDSNKLVYFNTVHAVQKEKKKRFIVFFSHQWLSTKLPDPKNRHFQEMLAAVLSLSRVHHVKVENIYIWVSYSSIPQDGHDQQQLAIDSLATYVSVCSAFVIIAPQVVHIEAQTPCNFFTYASRFWCRLEVFCSLLATLKVKASAATDAIPEGDENQEDGLDYFGLPPPPPPHPVKQVGEPSTLLQDAHQVYLVVDDQLHRLNFFTKESTLREPYKDLLYVFNGELECCKKGHLTEDGCEIPCEKFRVVDLVCGCFGALLCELRRTRRHRRDHDNSRQTLAHHIVSLRDEIFPPRYFDTRLEAMQAQVDKTANIVTKFTSSATDDGDRDNELEPLWSDSDSTSSSSDFSRRESPQSGAEESNHDFQPTKDARSALDPTLVDWDDTESI